jgi:uncharacterized membrane protein
VAEACVARTEAITVWVLVWVVDTTVDSLSITVVVEQSEQSVGQAGAAVSLRAMTALAVTTALVELGTLAVEVVVATI